MNIEWFNKIIELRKKEFTIPKISNELKISKATVCLYLQKAYEQNLLEKTFFMKQNYDNNKELIKYKKIKTYEYNILKEPFENLSFERLRKRVIIEQEEKCNRCNLDFWLNQPITLELEHKDGNNQNNKRENLEALCPNCHSLTDTWRGKNKNKNKEKSSKLKISNEDLYKLLVKNNFNIRQALLEAGMAAKGANYSKCYKIIEYFGVPNLSQYNYKKDIILYQKFKIIEKLKPNINELGWTKKLGKELNCSSNYASLLYTKYTKYKETTTYGEVAKTTLN